MGDVEILTYICYLGPVVVFLHSRRSPRGGHDHGRGVVANDRGRATLTAYTDQGETGLRYEVKITA